MATSSSCGAFLPQSKPPPRRGWAACSVRRCHASVVKAGDHLGEIRPVVGSGGSCERAGILAATPPSPTCCKARVRPRCQAMRFGSSPPAAQHSSGRQDQRRWCSITSSAATSRPGGTVRPSAFAVLSAACAGRQCHANAVPRSQLYLNNWFRLGRSGQRPIGVCPAA